MNQTQNNSYDPCHARGGIIQGIPISNRQLKKIRQRLIGKFDRKDSFGNDDLTPFNVTRKSITYR